MLSKKGLKEVYSALMVVGMFLLCAIETSYTFGLLVAGIWVTALEIEKIRKQGCKNE